MLTAQFHREFDQRLLRRGQLRVRLLAGQLRLDELAEVSSLVGPLLTSGEGKQVQVLQLPHSLESREPTARLRRLVDVNGGQTDRRNATIGNWPPRLAATGVRLCRRQSCLTASASAKLIKRDVSWSDDGDSEKR